MRKMEYYRLTTINFFFIICCIPGKYLFIDQYLYIVYIKKKTRVHDI